MLKSINSLCHIISGGTPKTNNNDYWNGSIPWISIKDFISCNRYVYETDKSITELGLNNSSTTLLQKNDIILSARGTVGEVALINKPMAFNQSCYGIRTKNIDELDQIYLFYRFKSQKSEILSGTHGAIFDTLTKNDFDRLIINLPTIIYQHHIVNTI